jgi:hypothetical protein
MGMSAPRIDIEAEVTFLFNTAVLGLLNTCLRIFSIAPVPILLPSGDRPEVALDDVNLIEFGCTIPVPIVG